MNSSYLRVALVLPPVQSFFMPYSAPAMLAAVLEKKFGVRTLVVDAGIDWLWSTVEDGQASLRGDVAALQQPGVYRDAFALREAFLRIEGALSQICAAWAPESVDSSGRYVPPGQFTTWEAVDESLKQPRARLFDQYFRRVLIPQLRKFRPQIIGLSVPFDWMLWPTMRLARWLRRTCPDVATIVGGPAIQRLWHDGQAGFFRTIDAQWAAIGDGERALCDLVEYLCQGTAPGEDSPLVRLPCSEPRPKTAPYAPAFYESGLMPNYSNLDLSRYLRPEPILPIPASEGCFYGRCRFCSRQRSDQMVPYVERSPGDAAAAMRQLHAETGARQFILAGDIFSHKFLLALAGALEAENGQLSWFCEASFKSSMASRLSQSDCDLLHRGGCRLILNGMESGSSRVRELMDCPTREEHFEQTLFRLLKAGIVPYVTIIFGYPGETEQDLLETIHFIQKHCGDSVFATSRFEIVPGTPLSGQLRLRPGAICTPGSVFDAGLEYEAPDTLGPREAGEILGRELEGMFGDFQVFYRHIPVLMQLLAKTGVVTHAASR
jgi:anaerobic magnesium-protoporphyrin IX monomethyl ester cyclase